MRIGVLSFGDPRSLKIWSGTTSFMVRALERHCGEVVALGPVPSLREGYGRVRSRLSRSLTGRPVPYQHSVALAREQGRLIRRRLARAGRLDALFAPAASPQLAFLETDLPVVYTSDTTYHLLHDYYPDFWDGTERARAEGDELEGRALRRADLVLYPSEWPLASARDHYGVDPAKVRVLPYGANLESAPPRERALTPKPQDACRIAWIGGDWERKGGPLAVEAVRLLREGGVDARLVIVGCSPPVEADGEVVRVVPRLHKGDPAQAAELGRILLDAHFLLLPTRSECYGMVFCEAAAHGTPSIACDTGGVSGAVHRGRNGYLLAPAAGAPEYASLIRELFLDRERYRALCVSSRDLYEERLNWDAWGKEVRVLLDRMLSPAGGLHRPPASLLPRRAG